MCFPVSVVVVVVAEDVEVVVLVVVVGDVVGPDRLEQTKKEEKR